MVIDPYGGGLIDLLVAEEEKDELKALAMTLPSVYLTDRAECDLELMSTGAFSPLDRFMGCDDHARVVEEMRLADGTLFPIPVTLPVDRGAVRLDDDVALRNSKNELLAIMTVEEAYEWERGEVARRVAGSQDDAHPLVAEMAQWGSVNISGPLRMLELPQHSDFVDLRMTPSECRTRLNAIGNRNVVAFQTRNPMHRVHEELAKRAATDVGGTLLIHPAVGLTKMGDVDHYTRVRTYKALIENYFEMTDVLLALLPLAMRMSGPREALWHTIIRRNYGVSHFIVGRDHAGPGKDSAGNPFYGPYDAQEMVEEYSEEVGVRVVPFRELVYLIEEGRYEESSRVAPGSAVAAISGTQVRDLLSRGERLPEWFTRPEVSDILSENYPPRHRQGFCVWFTGLSGAGKSATANALTELLMERGRHVSVLDGDVVRTNLSKGLGYSREDRDTNILRIGFVASEIVRMGGISVCAAISPYRSTRERVRSMVGADRFLEVFVNTPLEVCEERDTKGMYAMARRGEIQGFTGIDDPYEPPENPTLELETVLRSSAENAHLILDELKRRGFVRVAEQGQ